MTIQRYMHERSINGMADFALENNEKNEDLIKTILIDSGMNIDISLIV